MAVAAIFGICIFSFLNVIIYRVPRKLDWVKGRSMCTSCGHQLGVFDLVPIVSWTFLGGKCRYCGEKISSRYTIVEALGGMLAALSVWFFGATPAAILVFAFFSVLTVTAFVDLDTMEIPDGFVWAAGICGIIAVFLMPEVSIVERLIGFLSVSLPMLLITLAIPGAFGGGDIRLVAACGLFLGWELNLLAFFFAIVTGGIYGIYVLAGKKLGKKDHFAFGPFLCIGMVISLLAGDTVLRWYLGLL
ncbi:MAG: prepilin peptidase [Clostridia bacterium]|nr:prepilin peptidase [Clostridia bacterium]NCC43837.1 prepilin peptidase [Clostridia bacterium]